MGSVLRHPCTAAHRWPECEIIVVECVRWVGGDTAAAAVEGLVVHLAVGFGAALGGVDAENARDQDAELEKDDGGAGCDDDGQRRAHHVLLAVGPSLNEHSSLVEGWVCPWVPVGVDLGARLNDDLLRQRGVHS